MVLGHREWGPPGAEAVACVHGVGQRGEIFAALATRLAAAGRRVIALDLRGHGTTPARAPLSFETHLADLTETAAALGAAPATWIGHSFGARACAALAARSPREVAALVLLEPAFDVPAERVRRAIRVESREWGFATSAGATNSLLAAEAGAGASPELVAAYVEADLRRGEDGRYRFSPDGGAVVAAWEAMGAPNPEVAAVPTLLLRGAASHLDWSRTSGRYAAALGSLLSEATVAGGHNVFWSAPEETAAAIESFLGAAGGEGRQRQTQAMEGASR